MTRFFLLPFLFCLIFSCGRSYRSDSRLRHAEAVLSGSDLTEERALEMLDSLTALSENGLSDGERHYKAFLMIKAADKGFKVPESDSLYLTVKDYFSSRHREILPEVLYYGGRVYSDMGVYPIALQYFRDALGLMGHNSSDPVLRRRILCQTAAVLSSIQLYKDALPYAEESVALAKEKGDTLACIYNLELAGDICERMKDYPKASHYFAEACGLSKNHYPEKCPLYRFRVGYTTFLDGDTVTGLRIMNASIGEVERPSRSFALPAIAQAFLDADEPDSAYKFAIELIEEKSPLNKRFAYRVLLSDKLRNRLPVDTLLKYTTALDSILVDIKKERMAETARFQNTVYNYTVHDRARGEAEKERDRMKLWLVVAVGTMSILLLAFALRALRKERVRNLLFRTLAKRKLLTSTSDDTSHTAMEEKILLAKDEETRIDGMDERKRMMQEAEELSNDAARREEWARKLPQLIASSVYGEIKGRLDREQGINEKDLLWEGLGNEIEKVYPGFIARLRLLTEGRLTPVEEHTAMLVKCGFGVTDMTILLCRAKGTIVSRRASIALKIFNEKRGTAIIDALIRAL